MTISQRLAGFVVGAVPGEAATQQARMLLFDYLAIAIAGSTRASARSAFNAMADAGLGPSRVEGTSARLAPEQAALVNGISAHGLEIDDTHEQSSSHPGVVVWPALLALADAHEVSFGALLEAGVVGYDVMTALGSYIGAAETYGRGFHPTGISGAIGAAAGASRLLSLDETQTADAVALAANLAAGSLSFLAEGAWTKRLNAGSAAATGIRAALLARHGFVAPDSAFEDAHGWMSQYGSGMPDDRRLELRLGAGMANTSVKFYPCCRYMHGVMDLLIDLRRERPDLSSDEITHVEAAVISAGQDLVSLPSERKLKIESPVDAQFSMPFGAALTLATGAATLPDFERAPSIAPQLSTWMNKVVSVTSERVDADYPDRWTAEIHVRFSDGSGTRRRTEAFRGSPSRPASWDDLLAKATDLVGAEHADYLLSLTQADVHIAFKPDSR